LEVEVVHVPHNWRRQCAYEIALHFKILLGTLLSPVRFCEFEGENLLFFSYRCDENFLARKCSDRLQFRRGTIFCRPAVV